MSMFDWMNRWRRRVSPRGSFVLMVTGAIMLFATVACSTEPRLVDPDPWTVVAGDFHEPMDPDACPPDANTCEWATSDDKQRMLEDLDFHLDWDDPECVEVRDHLAQLFADPYYLIAKFDDFDGDGTPNGHWRKWYDEQDEMWKRAISFNESFLPGGSRDGLGWAGHRAKTGIHEGHHDRYESTDPEAMAFEEQCIHW